MNLLLQLAGLAFGLYLLIKGADLFVKGSVGIATWLKVPPIVVGLTIVAMGTSLPEIVISVSSAFAGGTDMAVGNVVGSNIFNLVLIMGVCGFIRPVNIQLNRIYKDYLVALGAALILLAMNLVFTDLIPRWASLLMLIFFAGYLGIFIKQALKSRSNTDTSQSSPATFQRSIGFNLLLVGVGAGLIFGGGQLTVNTATALAISLGISERVIGLTILAVGTSLPELVTCIIACKQGQEDLALGNIIGSSIFNILLILGLTGSITPLATDPLVIFDLSFLIISSLLFLWFAYTDRKIVRYEGGILIVLYVGYLTSLVLF